MRLGEALQISGRAAGDRKIKVHLLCGFTPLHLETFMKAQLALRFPDASVQMPMGLYGDLEGNIQRALEEAGDGAIAVVEWSDLDPRLGFRASAGWRVEMLDDTLEQVEDKCRRIEAHLTELAKKLP